MDQNRCVTLTESQWEKLLGSMPGSTTYAAYRCDAANRYLKLVQSIPDSWSDASNWRYSELRNLQTHIGTRWRVNLDEQSDLFLIVDLGFGWLSSDVLQGFSRPVHSAWLIAVRGAWSDFAIPHLKDDRFLLTLEEPCGKPSPSIKAAFKNGMNERDGSPFVFQEWVNGGPALEPEPCGDGKKTRVRDEDVKRLRRQGIQRLMDADWKQSDVAKAFGISESQVSRILSSRSK